MRVISDRQLKSDNINHWGLIILLCKGSPIFSDSWQEWKFRLKFIIRALISPRLTFNFLILLSKQPFLHSLLRAQPDLPCKLHRPYLSHTFNNRQKLDVLRDHFQLITQCMPKALHYNYLHRTPYRLVTLTGKGGEKYSLIWASYQSSIKRAKLR